MQTVNGGGHTIDDQEQLKEKIDRLENEIDRLKTEQKQPDQETPDGSPAGVSRRGFLKAVAGGAAGLGLTGMLPSAAALDIKSPHDLSYYGGGSTTPDLEIDTHGNLNLDGSNITNAGTINTEKLSVAGTPVTNTSSVTYYVDQANGDDSDAGTSKSEAFETYERALEEVPRFPDKQVTIRQIGDYSADSTVLIKNRKGSIYWDGSFSLRIVGDSEAKATDGNDQSNMETFDGEFFIEGVTGFEIDFLNINGAPWFMTCSGVTVNGCYLEGHDYLFAYARAADLNIVQCVLDGQANGPSYGVDSLSGSNVVVGGNTEIKNWDQQNKTLLRTYRGGKIIDGVQDKYPDAGRQGEIVPAEGRGIADAEFDRDLDGKELTNAGAVTTDQAVIDGVRTARTSDVTLYVDESNGDDSNGGTSKSEAFASYERVLEEVARFQDSASVIVEQIGDYSSDVTIDHRHFGDRTPTVRESGLKIRGESQTSGQGGTDPSNMETINGDIIVHGGSGIHFRYLHLNGRVSYFGSIHGYLNECKLGSGGTIFARNSGSILHINKCGLDPQSQDPVIGAQAAGGGILVTNNLTYQNWDPSANTYLSGIEGFVLDGDMFRGKNYDDSEVSRKGHVYPSDGWALAAPTNDLDLRGKPLSGLREVSNASAGDLSSGEWAFDDNRGGSGTAAWVFKDSAGTVHYKDFDGTL